MSRSPRSRFYWLTLVLWLAIIGCTPSLTPEPTPTPLPQSAWGPIYTIAYAPQVDAPAFMFNGTQIAFAWVASDAAGVHQDVRVLNDGGLTEPAALPLSPFAPRDLSVWPAIAGGSQLFYLDEDSATQTYRLYSAVFTAPHTLVQGPTLISDQRTANYSIMSGIDGTLQLVWSTGDPLESRLYHQRVDAAGRPQPAALLTVDADDPVLVRATDNQLLLFWLQPNNGTVYRAQLTDDGLQNVVALGVAWARQLGELLIDFSVIWTGSDFLLVWNTLLPDATPQVYGSLLTADAINIARAAPLTVTQSGSSQPLTWLTMTSSEPGLITAAMVGDELGLLQWNGQAFTNFQPVVTLQSPLIGLPQLQIDADSQFYLSWAEPRSETAAELRFTMTKSLGNSGS